MPSPLKPRSFKLTDDAIKHLKAVAAARNNTLSGTLRQLIQHAYEHQILGIPRCSSGSPCLVPATWEQHIALRRLAEARAEDPEPQPVELPVPIQPVIGQTDLDPEMPEKRQFANFLKSY